MESLSRSHDYGCCQSCHLVLRDPFIECHTCKIYICLDCYSKGKEFSNHKSNHDYTVVKHDFSVLSPDWNANEELQLLNGILHHGYGNWDEISKLIQTKSGQECRLHFQDVFLDYQRPEFQSAHQSLKEDENFRRDQPVPFLSNRDRPPRPASSRELAGYNAARGDFETEFENSSEVELNGIEFESLFDNLKCNGKQNDGDSDEHKILLAELEWTALRVYNDRLKKRFRMKTFVREHGLLNKRRTANLQMHYHLITENGPKYERLFDFRRLMCAFDFDYLLESFQHEMDLRRRIRHLQEFRSNGLTKNVSTSIYSKLKYQRDLHSRELSNESVRDWIASMNNITYFRDKTTGKMVPTTSSRKQAGPLNVEGLPSYEKLTTEEREICSEIRIYPENFLEIKTTMINECRRSNGLKLADARPVVKIDVNKTRKIYDFLLKHGSIYKGSSSSSSSS